ncbi:MAG: hypothetical protein SNI70_10845 [Rikenellaceae bacterium]
MNQKKCIAFIFSEIEPLLITKGDKMLFAALKEELNKETFAESLAEYLDGCWFDLDGRIAIHLDEWLESEDDDPSLDKLFAQNETLHIEGFDISKDLWYEQIIDLLRDGAESIKNGYICANINNGVLN